MFGGICELILRLPLTGCQRAPTARSGVDESNEVLEGGITGTPLESKGARIYVSHRPLPYERFLERLKPVNIYFFIICNPFHPGWPEMEEEIYLEMTPEWTNRFRESKAVRRLVSKRSHRK